MQIGRFPTYKSHPWHGIDPGQNYPDILHAFIEIIPSDTVKYELDKNSGFCKIDRLQKYSNILPALYGFVTRTYCGHRIGAAWSVPGQNMRVGDEDPLDICVLTERHISRGDMLVEAIPIGGLRLIDNNEVDDKVIAILRQDDFYGTFMEIYDLPVSLLDRLKHYFLTYKQLPDDAQVTHISEIYGKQEALRVLEYVRLDYLDLVAKQML